MYKALSRPAEAWHFDLKAPGEASEHKSLDLTFHTDGRMNAVVFWYTLELIEGITFSTGPDAVKAGMRSTSKYSCFRLNYSCSSSLDVTTLVALSTF